MKRFKKVPDRFISKQVSTGRYLFMDLSPPKDERFTLICAGREECAAGYDMNRADFRYYAMEYIASGRWELESRGKTWECGPGTIFAYDPDTSYRLRAVDDVNLIKFFVDFSGIEAMSKLKRAGMALGEPVKIANTRWIHDIFDQILSLSTAQKSFAKKTGTLLTELLLMRGLEDRLSVPHGNTSAHVVYMKCRRLIQKQFLTIRRASDVADACHVDQAYMSRIFKRFSGETPYQYLIRLKIDHAAELLIHREMSVKETAAEVGFDDPYHFSRVFKSQQGLSPMRFVGAMQRGG